MARILVATVPLTGHVHPMLLVVRALVERAHQVTWYAAGKFASKIGQTGATYVPMRIAPDWDDANVEAALPQLRGTRGLARVRAQLDAMFIAPAPAQLADLREVVDRQPADAVLADQAHLGAAFLAESSGLPWAQLGISALGLSSRDTAPFGTARPPAKTAYDRLANRFLRWLVDNVLFRATNRAYRHAREEAGLRGKRSYFDVVSPDLYLQPTVPSFEYPRSDLPPQVTFIGPLVPPPTNASLPSWWNEVMEARQRGTPIILVSQGTLATDPRELIRPALDGLASMDVLIVVTNPQTIEAPSNARVAAFVPYQSLLPHVSVMVTNGGYGGVQMALAAGVPLVVAGDSEEKPEIAARVRWSGAGIDLRKGRPRARDVRAAVQRVLADRSFADRAGVIATEMSRCNAPLTAALQIEDLIQRQTRVAA
ncbi:MAG: glycosyltransferase [Kofleriaceae bacterium]